MIMVSSVRRLANGAAHKLVKEGVSHELCKVWFHLPPECILISVSDEISDAFD